MRMEEVVSRRWWIGSLRAHQGRAEWVSRAVHKMVLPSNAREWYIVLIGILPGSSFLQKRRMHFCTSRRNFMIDTRVRSIVRLYTVR